MNRSDDLAAAVQKWVTLKRENTELNLKIKEMLYLIPCKCKRPGYECDYCVKLSDLDIHR